MAETTADYFSPQAFERACDDSGLTRKDIEKVAGPPNQVTPLPDGRTLLQWRATGYHIALVFEKNGRCFGVTHEYGRRVTAGSRHNAP